MLRPKDITDALGISSPTLRVWSNTFSPVLSPGAQKSTTESGGSAQRRYTEQDLAYFRKAKEFLASGLTFDQALEQLQALSPSDLAPDALSESVEGSTQNQGMENPVPYTPAVIEQTHPVIKAFEEALAAKDQALAAKDQVIASKEETIELLNARIDDLSQTLLIAKTTTPASAPSPIITPRFRWAWLNKLLTVQPQDVG